MTHITETRWICYRCETVETLSEREQPFAWYRVMVSSPPLANPFEVDDVSEYEICLTCAQGLVRYMDAKDETDD